MAHITAAEKAFRHKSSTSRDERDWKAVEEVYNQYGVYLELIGGDVPVEEVQSWLFEPQSIDFSDFVLPGTLKHDHHFEIPSNVKSHPHSKYPARYRCLVWGCDHIKEL